MEDTIYVAAMLIVVWGCYLRVAAVLGGALRTFRNRRSFVTFRLGWTELATVPEPVFLAVVTYVLAQGAIMEDRTGTLAVFRAILGATLVLVAWDLTIWSFFSWPSVFTGHGVLAGHRLVTKGAYGFVRHPIYLGVFLFWLGLAVAFASMATFLITALYVIPSYVLYMRAEERMMAEAFGDSYRAYAAAVPMLVPHRRGAAAKVAALDI